MAGCGGFTDLGHLLILADADILQKTVLAAIQHNVASEPNRTHIRLRWRAEYNENLAHDTIGIIQELAGRERVVRRKWGSCQGRGRTLLSVVR